MIQSAAEVVGVVGSEKLGAADRYVVGPVVPHPTGDGPRRGRSGARALRDQGITVIQASISPTRRHHAHDPRLIVMR